MSDTMYTQDDIASALFADVMGIQTAPVVSTALARSPGPLVYAATADPNLPSERHKWRSLGASAKDRNLHHHEHKDMVEGCSKAATRDGMIRSHTRLVTASTVGASEVGPIVQLKDEGARKLLQSKLDAFWCDAENDIGCRLPEFMDGLTTTGSLCVPVKTGAASKRTAIAYLDPAAFVPPGVLKDPGNALVDIAVLRAAWQSNETIAHPIIRKDGTVHRMFSAPNGKPLPEGARFTIKRSIGFGGDLRVITGLPCFYLGVNRTSPSQSVGVGDPYPALDLTGLLDELVFGAVQRSVNFGTYSLHVAFPKGTDQAEIDKLMEKIQSDLEAGDGRAVGTTEDIAIKSVQANLQSAEWATLYKAGRIAALMALGPWPIHMFTDGGTTNVATAAEQGSPVANFLLMRQNKFRRFWVDVCEHALRQVPECAALIEAHPDFKIELPLPTIVAKDTNRESATLQAETENLIRAVGEGLITLEAAQREYRDAANRYGFDIHADDMPDAAEFESKRQDPFGDRMEFPPGLRALDDEEEAEAA